MDKETILFLCALIPACALAETLPARSIKKPKELTVSLARDQQVFENSPAICAKNDTCDLKRVIFRREDYMIPPDDLANADVIVQSTRTFAGMITQEVDDLLRYSFVQYTRGCMWYSYATPNGGVETEFGVLRNFLGISQLQHIFPNWVVDTNDLDPIYGAGELGNRHYFVQSAPEIPAWIPNKQGKLLGEVTPTIPFGYVTDMTGPAYYSFALEMATNMSLEFKTCLFKTADVPLQTNGIDVDIGKAVVCFPWESKFVFDHNAREYKSPQGIHSECRRPFNPREKNIHLQRLDLPDASQPDKK